jgi:hypothetical protein
VCRGRESLGCGIAKVSVGPQGSCTGFLQGYDTANWVATTTSIALAFIGSEIFENCADDYQ